MTSQEQKKTRRTGWDLVQAIFGALPVRGVKTKSQIAAEIGSKPETVEEYLRVIMFVQAQPAVEEMRIGSRRYGYNRARAKKAAT